MEASKPTTVVTLKTEDRVAMSLDDIIKQQRKLKKPTKKPKPAAAGKQRGAGGVKSKEGKTTPLAAKAAGASKANRKARLDQRRGLNPTGKPTQQAVKAEVAKEAVKKQKQAAASKGQKPAIKAKAKANAKKPAGATGLQVAFNAKKPGATDRVVRQQVMAVMAKQPARPAAASGKQQPKRVVAKAGRGAGRR